MPNLKPSLPNLIYLAVGFFVLPKVVSMVRSKMG